jgi:hypothetical protein
VTLAAANASYTLATIPLTKGDWDISGLVQFGGATTNYTDFAGSIDTTAAVVTANGFRVPYPAFAPGVNIRFSLPTVRVSISADTTYYVCALSNYTVASPTAWAKGYARRAR